jgi:hypothetical protein
VRTRSRKCSRTASRKRCHWIRDIQAPNIPLVIFQITTDGFAPYVKAVADTLGDRVDFAQLIEVYKSSTEGKPAIAPPKSPPGRWSQLSDNPNPDRICTSIVERQTSRSA